jgi:hypothetical protein
LSPPFYHFIFIERDAQRCAALDTTKFEHPSRHIEIVRGEANEALKVLLSRATRTVMSRDRGTGSSAATNDAPGSGIQVPGIGIGIGGGR